MISLLDRLRARNLAPAQLLHLASAMRRLGHPEYADLCLLEASAQVVARRVEWRGLAHLKVPADGPGVAA